MPTPSAEQWYTRIGRANEIGRRTDRWTYRFFEMLPGILSWGTLGAVTFFSWWAPVWIAIFIIGFDVYWLLKTIYFSLHLRASFRKIRQHLDIDWRTRLENLPPDIYAAFNRRIRDYHYVQRPASAPMLEQWKHLWHLVVFPMYDESFAVMDASFRALAGSRYPLERMIVVLATEERAGEPARRVAEAIRERYGNFFGALMVTRHPEGIEGELAGKGSNETWATRRVKEELIDPRGIPYEHIITSVFDSDTRVEPHYFGCLTCHYLTAEHPTRSSFQPVPFYHNNIWDAPTIVRVVAASGTFWHLMKQAQPESLATFSSQSASFRSLADLGFWQTNVVSEDSRIFWQSFIAFDGDYRTVPLFYPVLMDAVLAPTLRQSLINQYKQQRRWAWGVENIPYILFGFLRNRAIPFSETFPKAARYIEGFWSWPTNALLIFLLGWLPLLLGGRAFNVTVLSANLPYITRMLMTIAMVGLISSAAYFLILLPKRPRRHGTRRHALMFLQWALLPFTIIAFGAIPALDAQTRLLTGRYMGFWVTPKHRLGPTSAAGVTPSHSDAPGV